MQANSRRVLSTVVENAPPGERLHDLGTADEGGHGEPAAERLAEDRDVGSHLVVLLAAARGDAEAGDRLVEDEENLMVARQLLQAGEVAGAGGSRPCSPRSW
jgi:hypothetical protein